MVTYVEGVRNMPVIDFIVNVLSTPAILVGLVALLGLVLQKKPIEELVKGTLKTIVGFLVLSAGASFLQSGSLLAFGEIFNYAFSRFDGASGLWPGHRNHYVSGYGSQHCSCTFFSHALYLPDRSPYALYGSYARHHFAHRRP